MKGICFAFDAFGQWSEHDRSKMKWRMKVGIEWRPSMDGWPKIGGQSAKDWWLADHLLLPFLHSPPLSPSLARPPHLWDRMEGPWPHGLAARTPSLAGRPPLGSPIKGLPRGTSSSHKLTSNLKFPQSFSMFLVCLS
jgi:hypothetical protein